MQLPEVATDVEPPLLVVTTVATADDAQRLAWSLVEARLAACAQIEAIDSVYRWQGRVEAGREYRVLFKTRPALYARVEAAIRALHPYELPAIHALASVHAQAAYARWVHDNSDGAPAADPHAA